MENNLEINLKKDLEDSKYINDTITLFCKSGISPWGLDDFIWEGEYENQKIVVRLPRGTSEELAKIDKPEHLKINNQIILEVKRVLHKLN